MTKKHFIALADALKAARPDISWLAEFDQWADDVNAIAAVCAASNPRFDRGRWLGYINGECGPNGGAR